MKIPFTKPYLTGNELSYIQQALDQGRLSGDGYFTAQCQSWLETHLNVQGAFLTHSCTAALEMVALLLDIQPGDEIIMPSYTFVSTANAFVLRGGVPVFIDIEAKTANVDARLIEAAITGKTKAIVVVHYAGVSCDMNAIMAIAQRNKLSVVEDAAQGVGAAYNNKPLGSIGQLAVLSFHATKNIVAGEGGALLINDRQFMARAEIIREKGTNRAQFFRGEVDKYRWVDIGSSFLPNELTAAFLYAQLEQMLFITQSRLVLWQHYHSAFLSLEQKGHCQRPIIPEECQHNGHIYYLRLKNVKMRDALLTYLREAGIQASFHYFPLHLSSVGAVVGRRGSSLDVTECFADTVLRLPLWLGMTQNDLACVVEKVETFFKQSSIELATIPPPASSASPPQPAEK